MGEPVHRTRVDRGRALPVTTFPVPRLGTRMDKDLLLGLAIVVASVVAVALIVWGNALQATAGVLLVIGSAVGFLVVVKDFIVSRDSMEVGEDTDEGRVNQ